VLSSLEPQPTSITLMMRDTGPKLDDSINLPKDNSKNSADALIRMMMQSMPQQAPPPQLPLPEADAAAVNNLTDMGFPPERAKKALLLNGNNLEAAMEWLFNHSEDPDIDEPLTQWQLQQLAGVPGGSGSFLSSMMGFMGGQPAARSPQPAPVAPEMAEILTRFEPLLVQIAVAVKDVNARPDIQQRLQDLESRGWKLSEAVRLLWAGERNLEVLQQGTDTNSAKLIERFLEHTKQRDASE